MNDLNSEVTSDDKLWAALAYAIPAIVPIIILLMADKRDRPFIKANNVPALILGIITIITSSFCIGFFVWLYQLYLAYQTYQGKMVEIPLITKFCKDQGWA